jgi:hypothetical protein
MTFSLFFSVFIGRMDGSGPGGNQQPIQLRPSAFGRVERPQRRKFPAAHRSLGQTPLYPDGS